MSARTAIDPSPATPIPATLDAASLRELCLAAGADDVGFVELTRTELDAQRADILKTFPKTKSLISFVRRLQPDNIRSPARSLANNEFHSTGHDVDAISRRIVERLAELGVRAANPSMGFPMEMDRFPGKIWVVEHKTVAVAAGLGRMGIHRSVIHPRFGSFVLLGSVLIDHEVSDYGATIDFDPCLECKLCVAACPVGAIKPDGDFDFSACYTHNYREFMGGFTDWVEEVAESASARGYRLRVRDDESASWWQSLSYGANYKAAYCLAVCPAGEDVIGLFDDKVEFQNDIVKPLKDKRESLYVVRGSDAEAHARKRFPHKDLRYVGNSLRPSDLEGFVSGMPQVFQRGIAKKRDVRIHFEFSGAVHRSDPERPRADADPAVRLLTVAIQGGKLEVLDGHVGKADTRVRAGAESWVAFLRKDRGLLGLLLRRKIRVRGSLLALQHFGRCFLG